MGETIVVGGRVCQFSGGKAGRCAIYDRSADSGGVSLNANGEWVVVFGTPYEWESLSAAREFAAKHADSQEREHACKVCSNWPDENGILEHGKGCYTQSEDGGGSEYIEEADKSKHADDPRDQSGEPITVSHPLCEAIYTSSLVSQEVAERLAERLVRLGHWRPESPEPSAAGGLIYLASPYSHEDTAIRDERFNIVCRVAARLMAQGHLIFSPIAHTHPIAMAGELPTGWDFWQKYDHAHLDAAAQVWVLRIDGWDRSTGVKAEIDYAMSKGKPVAYICPTPNDLHPAPATELAELRADNAKLRSGFHAQLAIAAEGVRENAELRAEVERLTKERDAVSDKLYTLRNEVAAIGRYGATEGHDDEGGKIIGLAYDGSIWGPSYDPKYEPCELLEKIEAWLKERTSEAIARSNNPVYSTLTTRAEAAEREREVLRDAVTNLVNDRDDRVSPGVKESFAKLLAPTGDADAN